MKDTTKLTALGEALGCTDLAPGALEPETRIFECPVGDCPFKGTNKEIDIHQVATHLDLYQKEIDYKPFADQE